MGEENGSATVQCNNILLEHIFLERKTKNMLGKKTMEIPKFVKET